MSLLKLLEFSVSLDMNDLSFATKSINGSGSKTVHTCLCSLDMNDPVMSPSTSNMSLKVTFPLPSES